MGRAVRARDMRLVLERLGDVLHTNAKPALERLSCGCETAFGTVWEDVCFTYGCETTFGLPLRMMQ